MPIRYFYNRNTETDTNEQKSTLPAMAVFTADNADGELEHAAKGSMEEAAADHNPSPPDACEPIVNDPQIAAEAARALARMGRGKTRRYSLEEQERRRERLKLARVRLAENRKLRRKTYEHT